VIDSLNSVLQANMSKEPEYTEVSLDKLVAWDPFKHCVWEGMREPITQHEVQSKIQDGCLRSELHHFSRSDHAARIAYLVVNKSHDPIIIDVGCPSLGFIEEWIILDGNHRLAAAFYRGDEVIRASISGEVDYATKLLGVPESAITIWGSPNVQSDGTTVWVNSGITGTCVGRFGKGGIDIHHDIEAQMKEGKQCLNCTHHKPTNEDWAAFVQGMKQHYDIEVGEEHKPTWLENVNGCASGRMTR
jgi:hypothetical protein